jgi:hypothetical protein
MKTGVSVEGMGMVIPEPSRELEAVGFSSEKVRRADIISEVRFSREYRALGSVVAGWMVAW